MALARAAIDYHQVQIDRYDIDCDWSQPGKYQTASSYAGVRDMLEPFARELDGLKEPYRWIDRAELPGLLGTTHFKAAVWCAGLPTTCRKM